MENENLQLRITEISKHEATLQKMEALLSRMEEMQEEWGNLRKDFQQMMEYYTGDEWTEDLKLDEQGLFRDLPRGVLSEDEIYNVFTRNTQLAFRLARTALDYVEPGA